MKIFFHELIFSYFEILTSVYNCLWFIREYSNICYYSTLRLPQLFDFKGLLADSIIDLKQHMYQILSCTHCVSLKIRKLLHWRAFNTTVKLTRLILAYLESRQNCVWVANLSVVPGIESHCVSEFNTIWMKREERGAC